MRQFSPLCSRLVIPAQAGIQRSTPQQCSKSYRLGPRLRGDDEGRCGDDEEVFGNAKTRHRHSRAGGNRVAHHICTRTSSRPFTSSHRNAMVRSTPASHPTLLPASITIARRLSTDLPKGTASSFWSGSNSTGQWNWRSRAKSGSRIGTAVGASGSSRPKIRGGAILQKISAFPGFCFLGPRLRGDDEGRCGDDEQVRVANEDPRPICPGKHTS
jgi:hypothetical protein